MCELGCGYAAERKEDAMTHPRQGFAVCPRCWGRHTVSAMVRLIASDARSLFERLGEDSMMSPAEARAYLLKDLKP